MSIVIITGSIAPYTHRLYEAYAQASGEGLTVLACAAIEPHRAWQVPEPEYYKLEVLPGWRRHASYTSHVYLNPAVIPALRRLKPDTIILSGSFSPTMALGSVYARATKTPYGIAIDGALATDPGETSLPHAMMRRLLVPSAKFGICASEASVDLLARWGLPRDRATGRSTFSFLAPSMKRPKASCSSPTSWPAAVSWVSGPEFGLQAMARSAVNCKGAWIWRALKRSSMAMCRRQHSPRSMAQQRC
jgi:hypothetical protein